VKRSAALLCLTMLIACAPAPAPAPSPDPLPAAVAQATAVVRSNLELAPAPAPGEVTRTVVQESPATVTHILRIAPGGVIPEHHHPVHEEVLILERGAMSVTLNGNPVELRTGDVAFIPAGTAISGRNAHQTEARAIAVFSNIGRPGPLTVPGRPHH
jgi:quercetin dioxygenase-like cupin family protein